MTPDAFDLIQMQTEALFIHNANGRLVRINESEPHDPAPRLFLGRTAEGVLWRVRADVPDELATRLGELASREPLLKTLDERPLHEKAYEDLLVEHGKISGLDSGPAFWLPEHNSQGNAIRITKDNAASLRTHFSWLEHMLDEYGPVAAVSVNDVAVAVCFSSRLTARVGEAGVFTQADYRGRGYAVDTVRLWAAGTRESGRLPLYSTSWENEASRGVAQKLGAVQYGVDFSIT